MDRKQRAKRYPHFQAWLNSELAHAFLNAEAEALSERYAQIQGDYLVIIGDPKFSGCVEQVRIEPRILINQQVGGQTFAIPLVSRQDKLPIAEASVASVYLAHGLEWDPDPHEILREANRVLKPEGDLMITGFNLWSLWGAVYRLRQWIRKPAWGGTLFSLTKLKDWLGLLGFDILSVKTFFFRPPVQSRKILDRFTWLESIGLRFLPEFGGGFVIQAKKRLIPLTPIKPVFIQQADLLPEGVMDLRTDETRS